MLRSSLMILKKQVMPVFCATALIFPVVSLKISLLMGLIMGFRFFPNRMYTVFEHITN